MLKKPFLFHYGTYKLDEQPTVELKLVSLSAPISPTGLEPSRQINISGRVLDQSDHKPIEEAKVYIQSRRQQFVSQTDFHGDFSFSLDREFPGEISIIVLMDGYIPHIEQDITKNVEISLVSFTTK